MNYREFWDGFWRNRRVKSIPKLTVITQNVQNLMAEQGCNFDCLRRKEGGQGKRLLNDVHSCFHCGHRRSRRAKVRKQGARSMTATELINALWSTTTMLRNQALGSLTVAAPPGREVWRYTAVNSGCRPNRYARFTRSFDLA